MPIDPLTELLRFLDTRSGGYQAQQPTPVQAREWASAVRGLDVGKPVDVCSDPLCDWQQCRRYRGERALGGAYRDNGSEETD